MDKTKYCNEVMARLEELMYQELSGMAYWKCEFIGADFIRAQNIKGSTVPEIVESCAKVMVDTVAEHVRNGSKLTEIKFVALD